MTHVIRREEGICWRQAAKRTLAGALAVAFILSAGCAPLRQRREAVEPSGFLGDYSQLKENDQYEAYLIYVNPQANWSRYNAIMIDSVSLWASGDKVSAEDRAKITGLMYNALHDTLGKNFTIATGAGLNVLRIRAAITEAKGAKVALNVVTSIVPQLRAVSTLGGMAADTSALVGEAAGELEIVDSVSGVRLAAAVDRRTGTKALLRANKFSKWADVGEACQLWANNLDKFLVENGVRQKSAASAR